MSTRSTPLTGDALAAFAHELEVVRDETRAALGDDDARYIRSVRAAVRYTEAAGRGLLFMGLLPPAWIAGTALLGLSKILDNMELGHNVLHGQYDWMGDDSLHSQTYEWDHTCPGESWRHSHNLKHHTFTNIIGHDRDVGYGLLRLFPDQPWSLRNLPQPVYALVLAINFEWGVALHDAEVDRLFAGERSLREVAAALAPILRKGARQAAKDYLVFPLLAGPAAPAVLLGNLSANLIRNLWTFGIIFCGHFTADAEVFPATVLEDERPGHWYLRQLRGSSNLDGGRWFHLLTGNLSFQIEHHLFPDIPSRRYAEMAPRVREICSRFGQHYNTGSFISQFWSVLVRIMTYSLPTFAGSPTPTEA
jgi:NADPH-dependent stearoyl-CoA 9-desaturase